MVHNRNRSRTFSIPVLGQFEETNNQVGYDIDPLFKIIHTKQLFYILNLLSKLFNFLFDVNNNM